MPVILYWKEKGISIVSWMLTKQNGIRVLKIRLDSCFHIGAQGVDTEGVS